MNIEIPDDMVERLQLAFDEHLAIIRDLDAKVESGEPYDPAVGRAAMSETRRISGQIVDIKTAMFQIFTDSIDAIVSSQVAELDAMMKKTHG